jgi:hypothetical protein
MLMFLTRRRHKAGAECAEDAEGRAKSDRGHGIRTLAFEFSF